MISERPEGGFSLIEVLIAMALFSIISIGFYMVLTSSTRSAGVAQSVAAVSSEARFGINRMLRETREADSVLCSPSCPTSTSYTVAVDYDQDGVYGTPAPDGSYEQVTFEYDPTNQRILIRAGAEVETLIDGVQQIPGRDVFSYSSNRLEYDRSPSPSGSLDGRVSWQEVDQTSGIGNTNNALDTPELGYMTNVSFAFRVVSGSRQGDFYGEAQLRNRR